MSAGRLLPFNLNPHQPIEFDPKSKPRRHATVQPSLDFPISEYTFQNIVDLSLLADERSRSVGGGLRAKAAVNKLIRLIAKICTRCGAGFGLSPFVSCAIRAKGAWRPRAPETFVVVE